MQNNIFFFLQKLSLAFFIMIITMDSFFPWFRMTMVYNLKCEMPFYVK